MLRAGLLSWQPMLSALYSQWIKSLLHVKLEVSAAVNITHCDDLTDRFYRPQTTSPQPKLGRGLVSSALRKGEWW